MPNAVPGTKNSHSMVSSLHSPGDSTRLFRTVYLVELTAKGPTLDAQARWLASWLEDTMGRLDALSAPERLMLPDE